MDDRVSPPTIGLLGLKAGFFVEYSGLFRTAQSICSNIITLVVPTALVRCYVIRKPTPL